MDQSAKEPARVAHNEVGARFKASSAKIQRYLLGTRIGFHTLDLIAAYTNPTMHFLTVRSSALFP